MRQVAHRFVKFYFIQVPVFPSRAWSADSREVIKAFLPALDFTKLMAASTFGSIEPGAK